ncbi:tyrosinase-like protein [Podospora appendiculata]|uniref:Tyrosinase-like protein n=1 Tax=Podospora appendiculata TaxID=314037 RepID=A0AAE0XBA7_9PEZI|nr:tyrosinase-like protein [Podospora appendiculata]
MEAGSCTSVPTYNQREIDSGAALASLNAIALKNVQKNYAGSCNARNVKVRQEWRTLSKAQRKQFIAAVQCTQKAKSAVAPGTIPGIHSAYDDFTYVHINQTNKIHLTGSFLTWHRYFISIYEQKLHACGYTGNLPYWEWGFDVNSLRDSPVFDGSDTSLGSNGAYFKHEGIHIPTPQPGVTVDLGPGTGGGCVFKGPFKDLVVTLGPVNLPIYGSYNATSAANPFADNPRCLKRDLNIESLQRFSSFRNTTELILNQKTVEWFQGTMQGEPPYLYPSLGVHGGGHNAIGGDPGSDPSTSPGDPSFYLHHAQVDRVYWIWQNLDWANRQGVFGPVNLLNYPPGPNTTLEDYLPLEPLGKPVQIKSVINTVGGSPLCYVYI